MSEVQAPRAGILVVAAEEDLGPSSDLALKLCASSAPSYS